MVNINLVVAHEPGQLLPPVFFAQLGEVAQFKKVDDLIEFEGRKVEVQRGNPIDQLVLADETESLLVEVIKGFIDAVALKVKLINQFLKDAPMAFGIRLLDLAGSGKPTLASSAAEKSRSFPGLLPGRGTPGTRSGPGW